jgi:hypothetical protein
LKSEIKSLTAPALVAAIVSVAMIAAGNAADPQVAAIPAAEVICIDGVPICRAPVEPTATPSPTVTPKAVTATPTVQAVGPNLLSNPGFEGRVRTVVFPEITVFEGWDPYYCDQPYTAQKCPVPPEWNPYRGLPMKRPEFKPGNPEMQNCSSSYMNRVHSGCNSQQAFSYSGVSNEGVQYTVRNIASGRYVLTAWAQLWVSDSGRACLRRDANNHCIAFGGNFESDIATKDDRTAMFARLGYDPTCGTNAFAPSVVWSQDYGYAQGFYDKYQQMSLPIQVTGDCVTVFIGGYNRFAKSANNLYIDDASLRRAQ